MKIAAFFRALSPHPEARIIQHLEHMRESITIPKGVDKKNFDSIYEAFNYAANRLKLYRVIRAIVFILLYMSAIFAVANKISPAVATAIQPLVGLSSVIGVGVLTLLFLASNRVVSIVQMELIAEHSHLIAILAKHNKDVEMHPKYYLGLIPSYKNS